MTFGFPHSTLAVELFYLSNVLLHYGGWIILRGVLQRVAHPSLAFTRYSFTSRLLCTNLTPLDPIRPSALATLLQYYCTTIGQYSTPSRPPFCMPYTIQDW